MDRGAHIGGTGAALLTLAPVAVLLASALTRPSWALPVGITSGSLIAIGGLWYERRALGRWMASAGFLLLPAASFERLRTSPALTLVVVSTVAIGVFSLWNVPLARRIGAVGEAPSAEERRLAALRGASLVALVAWTLAGTVPLPSTLIARASAAVALCVALGFVGSWTVRYARGTTRWTIGVAAVLGVAGAAVLPSGPGLASLALGPVVALLRAAPSVGAEAPSWLSVIVDRPARLVVTTFLALGALGTGLLTLPLAAADRQSIGFLDASFTSVSAVCVTGLIVLDTPRAFSAFGQAAILLLIQVGGLGIMSFYTVALQFLGRRLSLRHELTVAGAVGIEHSGRLFGALRRVLGVTFACELAGALVLTMAFARAGDPIPVAVWRGVFTAVSAFCNAGFALQTDSLMPYQTDLVVLHTVAALIVVGGLSPLALVSLPRLARRQPVLLQVKIVYAVTAILLVLGTLAFAAFEWSESLGHLTRWQRAHNAWFQSVTLRTAGFNSVDLNRTGEATRSLMMALMLIGGSPGGTAGGLKTTTTAVLVLAVVAALRGRSQVVAFGRHILHTSVYKAAAVATLGMLSVVTGIAAVQLTQKLAFDVAVFEVVSAIGTVGLTLGATAALDEVGKILIMVCMFMGRVGPLTLFLFLVDRRPEADWDYPDEAVDVG